MNARTLCLAAACLGPACASADLTTLSLEQLLQMPVLGASKYAQTSAEVAAAVSVITRDEIRAHGWRTLAQALSSLPGVHNTYDRQYSRLGVRVLGLPWDYNTRLLVTVNGNRINEATYDGAPIGRDLPIDLDLVERIEFVPGPGGAIHGQNAMLGVVNVITRDGASVAGFEWSAARGLPQRDTEQRLTWGHRTDDGLDMLLSLTGQQARGEDRFFAFGASGITGVARGLDGARDREFHARVARGNWSFEFTEGRHRKDDPTGSYFSDPLVPGQFQGDSYTLAHWQYRESLAGDTLQLQARVFWGRQRYASVLSYGTPFAYPARSTWHGLEVNLLSTAFAGHKLLGGIEFQNNPRISQASEDTATPANTLRQTGNSEVLGLFLQDDWALSDTLSATVGLRVDHGTLGGTAVSPRAALIWQAGAHTSWKLLAGRAHRAPSMYERDYTDNLSQVGNPALRGERIDTAELVLDHMARPDLQLRASVYRWRMVDVIMPGIDPVSGLGQFRTGPQIRATGLELSADRHWDSGARLRGSVALQSARDAHRARVPNSPRLLGKLLLTTPLPLPGLQLAYELQVDGSRYTLAGRRLGTHALSHIRLLKTDLVRGLDLGLGIRNLFDRRYEHPGADTNWQDTLEQDGRSLRVDLTLRF